MKVTKRRKISNDLLDFGFKGELLEVVERNLDYQSATELKRRLNNRRTKREREEIIYWVEEE
jgi:hypothetical protein